MGQLAAHCNGLHEEYFGSGLLCLALHQRHNGVGGVLFGQSKSNPKGGVLFGGGLFGGFIFEWQQRGERVKPQGGKASG